MSKLDDKDLANIAAGTSHSIVPDAADPGDGTGPDHGSVEGSSPPDAGGGTGLEDEGSSGGSSGIGQG